MACQKNKSVSNFILEELKFVNLDQSQIWSVRHKVVNKSFTMKRIKIKRQKELLSSTNSQNNQNLKIQQAIMANVNRQISILKRLEGKYGPKCIKMIKTSNNIYLVYDQFPSISLKNYMNSKTLPLQSKIKLLIQICKSLHAIHKKNTVLLHFDIENIFFNEQKPIFFSFWGLSRMIQNLDSVSEKQILIFKSEFPEQVVKFGSYGFPTDIYCLGNLFKRILEHEAKYEKHSVQNNILLLIQKMLANNPIDRPKIVEILMELQRFQNELNQKFVDLDQLLNEEGQTPKYNNQSQDENSKLKIKKHRTQDLKIQPKKQEKRLTTNSNSRVKEKFVINYFVIRIKQPKQRLNRNKSMNIIKFPSSKLIQSVKPSSPTTAKTPSIQPNQPVSPVSPTTPSTKSQSFSNFLAGVKSFANLQLLTNQDNQFQKIRPKKLIKQQDPQKLIKQFNKKRNLSLFLLEICQFVIQNQQDFQLSYLIVKLAIINLSSLIKLCQKYQTCAETNSFIGTIKSEYDNLINVKKPLQKYFQLYASESKNIHNEIIHPDKTSQRYLKEKILKFSREMILSCEKDLVNNNQNAQLIDKLFHTYMILKYVQEGSFQKFWDKTYDKERLLLSNQRYFNDQKSLGIRYLKSRIAQIVKNK